MICYDGLSLKLIKYVGFSLFVLIIQRSADDMLKCAIWCRGKHLWILSRGKILMGFVNNGMLFQIFCEIHTPYLSLYPTPHQNPYFQIRNPPQKIPLFTNPINYFPLDKIQSYFPLHQIAQFSISSALLWIIKTNKENPTNLKFQEIPSKLISKTAQKIGRKLA